MELHFHIKDWRGWDSAVDDAPDLSGVPAAARRRLSPLGRSVFATALPLIEQFGKLPIVFASRHGESGRTLQLLNEIVGDDLLSPAAFSLSVHNAIAGVLAIQTGSQASVNAIAAGREDLHPVLIEALGMSFESHTPVLCLFADGTLPEIYEPLFADTCQAYALALVIEPGLTWHLRRIPAATVAGAGRLSHSLQLLRELHAGSREVAFSGHTGTLLLQGVAG